MTLGWVHSVMASDGTIEGHRGLLVTIAATHGPHYISVSGIVYAITIFTSKILENFSVKVRTILYACDHSINWSKINVALKLVQSVLFICKACVKYMFYEYVAYKILENLSYSISPLNETLHKV